MAVNYLDQVIVLQKYASQSTQIRMLNHTASRILYQGIAACLKLDEDRVKHSWIIQDDWEDGLATQIGEQDICVDLGERSTFIRSLLQVFCPADVKAWVSGVYTQVLLFSDLVSLPYMEYKWM